MRVQAGKTKRRGELGLTGFLRARRPELEQAAIARVKAIADPAEIADPVYRDGLVAAVPAALDYGMAVLGSRGRVPPVPAVLLAQARLAARNGVGLDTVLRRYFAGYSLLADFLVELAGEQILDPAELKRLSRNQARLFDHLIDAVSDEFAREANRRPDTPERHRVDRVRRLLAGELLDLTEFGYDLAGNHLGLVAVGSGAKQALRAVAAAHDHRLLLVQPDQYVSWAWFGSRRQLDPARLQSQLSPAWPPEATLAFGEPAQGLAGWRLTHHQAATALSIAQRNGRRMIRYSDVALLAAVLRDRALACSMIDIFLAPLSGERDGGAALRDTLRAYFTAGGNVSSAAAALGVSRQTVSARLRVVEEHVGRSLDSCAAELKTALDLLDLGYEGVSATGAP